MGDVALQLTGAFAFVGRGDALLPVENLRGAARNINQVTELLSGRNGVVCVVGEAQIADDPGAAVVQRIRRRTEEHGAVVVMLMVTFANQIDGGDAPIVQG